ncbi:MAG: response regulator [Thermodesulfobacteriota bacterium]
MDIAGTCREALDRAAGSSYDFALVDVNLADGNGLDLIEPIRKFSPDIGIISMTGDNPLSLKADTRKQQVTYHLSKPFDFQELVSVLTHLARSAQALSC